MRETAGEPDRRKMKRDKKRECEGNQWGVGGVWGIDNLTLLDGIKELVMQESLYWRQWRL